MSNTITRAILLLAACQACTLALAQNTAQPATPRPSAGASFVCGGVGDADQRAIKAQAAQHHLMLTFAVSTGAYLADVDVQIRDAKGGVVLSAKCGGPIMLVDLPSGGTWHVRAEANGQVRERTLTAGSGRPVQATFTWPAGTS